jgi:hypothetical protein
VSPGVFRHPHQPGGTPRDQVVGQRRRVAGTGKAAIEMDFGETSRDVGSHEDVSVLHGLVGGQVPPPVWAEMVAPQQDPRRRQAAAGSCLEDQVAKVLGPHTRVATGLVDLVRGSFDQHVTAVI